MTESINCNTFGQIRLESNGISPCRIHFVQLYCCEKENEIREKYINCVLGKGERKT